VDVSSLLGDLPTVEVTVRTYNTTTVDTFGETAATYADVVRTVVAHPAGRKTMERLFGRDHGVDAWSFYSAESLATVGTVKPNKIQHQGRWYEVVEAADYADMGGLYLATAKLTVDAT
jgi:hypothetical protein